MKILSLGAGVQSSALLIMSAKGVLPKLDAAIFSDTGWEPQEVYNHLDRIEKEFAQPAGIPIYRVSVGNIRSDALDPNHNFASMPLFVRKNDGTFGMARRQCTNEYKIVPIMRKIRELLGAEVQENKSVGRVKGKKVAEQWIGISLDEIQRAKDSRVQYIKNEFPLLDLKWTRKNALAFLEENGIMNTPKSACIGCPFRTNEQWRDLRDNNPAEFADAVEFDKDMREFHANQPRTKNNLFYLHKSYMPLDEAPLEIKSRKENEAIMEENQLHLFEQDFTCSPFACNGDEESFGVPVFEPDEIAGSL